jgi:hypothetical protein
MLRAAPTTLPTAGLDVIHRHGLDFLALGPAIAPGGS